MRHQRFLPVESWITTSFWQQEAEAGEVIIGGEADEVAELRTEFGAKSALLWVGDVEDEVMKEWKRKTIVWRMNRGEAGSHRVLDREHGKE
jgi:hypothetical protein